VLAGSIVTDGDSQHICHRHAPVPHPQHIWFRFSVLTSSVFSRRRVIHERALNLTLSIRGWHLRVP
jgi:hypothetical protein